MEMVLALAVVVAVIIFGALISVGNERQRRAIDRLREQVVSWAIQDLNIKTEKLASEVRIDDPLGWLNKVATRIVGANMNLQMMEYFESPTALVCAMGDDGGWAVFSPFSPLDIRRARKERKSQLLQYANNNPLMSLPRGTDVYEITTLNAGLLFGLELPLAWKSLSGQEIRQTRIWLYILAQSHK